MKYPDCPENTPDACRFSDAGSSITCMHSPIVFDRDNNPVGGGCNTITGGVRCQTCGKMWNSKQTELERIQSVDPEWTEMS